MATGSLFDPPAPAAPLAEQLGPFQQPRQPFVVQKAEIGHQLLDGIEQYIERRIAASSRPSFTTRISSISARTRPHEEPATTMSRPHSSMGRG